MRHTYVVYARKSQEDQGRQVQSIHSQTQEARQLTARELLHVKEVITESRSAKETGNRPEFDRMIRMIERGEVDGIIAWRPDRLSRNETDAASVTRLLRRGNSRPPVRFLPFHQLSRGPHDAPDRPFAEPVSELKNGRRRPARTSEQTVAVMSWVTVPSQRSAIVHLVPRTVAAAYLPLVLNLPLALAWSSWRTLLEAAAAVASPAFLPPFVQSA